MFNHLAKNNLSGSQLTVYRKEQLIYYVFIRKLAGENNYFGIALIFNSVYCRDIHKFYRLFQETIFEIAKQGKILQIQINGEISFAVQRFYHKHTDIEKLRVFFQEKINDNRYLFVPFDSNLKLGNDSFKTILSGNNGFIEKESNFYFSKKKPNTRSKRGLVATLVVLIIIGVMLCFIIKSEKKKEQLNIQKQTLITEGERLRNERQYEDALDKFHEAYSLDTADIDIKTQIENAEKERETIFNIEKENANKVFNLAKSDPDLYRMVVYHCDNALSCKKDNKEMKNLKEKAEERIKK